MFEFTDIAFITGIVVAISELLKLTKINPKFLPIINLALGLIFGFVYVAPEDPKTAVMAGLIIGLTASGVYSGSKNVMEGIKQKAVKKE